MNTNRDGRKGRVGTDDWNKEIDNTKGAGRKKKIQQQWSRSRRGRINRTEIMDEIFRFLSQKTKAVVACLWMGATHTTPFAPP